MSLDGLRAWIGEVERKLGMRTRVFLVLAVIAIGGAGAAIYLAIDTRENAVSESDVQALQEKLEARIDAGGAAGSTQLEVEPEAPQPEGEASPGGGEGGTGSSGGGSGGGGSKGASGGEGSANETAGGAGSGGGGAGSETGGGDSAGRLKELLEQTRAQNERAERGRAE